MPDWGAIFENRANYPGVKMQKLLGGTPALLSCSAVFAQLTAECPLLYNGPPLLYLKTAPTDGASGLHLIHGSLGHPRT